MDVDIGTRAVSDFVVMPTQRGSTGKRKRESEKTQNGRGLHCAGSSELVVEMEGRRRSFDKRVTGQKTKLLQRYYR